MEDKKKLNPQVIIYIYLLIGIINLVSRGVGINWVDGYTKPLLMPLLIFFVYRYAEGYITISRLLLVVALLFSWIGDLLLMGEGELFFLGGLVSFLIAQILYSFILYQSTTGKMAWRWMPSMLFILYAFFLLSLLVPGSGLMGFPIAIYGVGITVMITVAGLRKGLTGKLSYLAAMIGAILFVISDSIIAIDAFYSPVLFSGVWIMSTYIVAQLLLAMGILNHK